MSTEITKKRGRPKNALAEEVLVVAPEIVTPAKRATGRRKVADGAKLALESCTASATAVKGLPETGKVAAKTNAKKSSTTPTVSKSAKNGGGPALNSTSTPTSSILQQADAFGRAPKLEGALSDPEAGQKVPEARRESESSKLTPVVQKKVTRATGSLDDKQPRRSRNTQTQAAKAIPTPLHVDETLFEGVTEILNEDVQSEVHLQPEHPAVSSEPEAAAATLASEIRRNQEAAPKPDVLSATNEPGPNLEKAAGLLDSGRTNILPISPTTMSSNPKEAPGASMPSAPTPKPTPLHPAWTGKLPSPSPLSNPPRPMQPAPPPKLAELPYDKLTKVPAYRAASRKVTSVMVAIPIALVTSYVLYDRYVNGTVQKHTIPPPSGIVE